MRKEIFIGPIIVVIIWCVLTVGGYVNPLLLPAPTAVLRNLWDLLRSGDVFGDLGSTIYRTLVGYICAGLIGIPLGLLVGYVRRIYYSFEFVIDFFRSMPSPVLVPVAMLLFGLGDASKIAIIAFTCGLINLINSMYGVTRCKKVRVMVAKTMRATPIQTFKYVVFPDALPHVFVGLRLTLSLALILAVVTEMFTGTVKGLGRRIYDSHDTYNISEMYACILLIGIVGYVLNRAFVSIEKTLIHWSGR
ncbi:MAG: ABC transporter permease [Planctomycetes bacterium]|nr:ABC transporter permease [Planctomycetota bacterium]